MCSLVRRLWDFVLVDTILLVLLVQNSGGAMALPVTVSYYFG